MKTSYFNKTIIILLITFTNIILGCSEEDLKDEKLKFELFSEEIDCSRDGNYIVPFSGRKFIINVLASDKVEWEVIVESGDLISVTPHGKQSGEGCIELTASENPEKELGHKSTIVISNSINDIKRTITFEQKEKMLYFPEGTEGQTSEEFKDPNSKYNIHYMKEGENVAILWDKALGIKPTLFDEDRAIKEADEAFRFLHDKVGFASRSSNPANINKFLIFINKEVLGAAYGGGNKGVGMIWLGSNTLGECEQNNRYGIYYHEMCHCFQAMAKEDGGYLEGPIHEMTSQYAMVQKFPNWMELEKFHVKAFMQLTHLAFGHEGNNYHSPWVLEYWENIRGPHFIPKLWEDSNVNDNGDFIAAYKRITGLSQEEFNDELFDAYRHFIAWDIPSIKEESKNFINMHSCKLYKDNNNGYTISKNYCPQNYGYNAIKIDNPKPGTKIKLTLMGMLNLKDYKVENKENACWRFGFVAINNNGDCIYSDMGKTSDNATLDYEIPENINNLWLVVMASPLKHTKHVIDKSLGENTEKRIYNQWPYKIILTNANIDEVNFIE